MRGWSQKAEELQLFSPFAGTVIDLQPELKAGQWLSDEQPLATLIDTDGMQFIGYLPEEDLMKIASEQAGRFIADVGEIGPYPVSLLEIDKDSSPQLDQWVLSSHYGGSVASQLPIENKRSLERKPVPKGTVYRVRWQVDQSMPLHYQRLTGVIVFRSKQRVLILDWLNHALSVLIRESGF